MCIRDSPASSSNTPSLETALNPDGSLRSGVSGSFNAEGFSIAYGPDGGPRFVAHGAASAMADGYTTFRNDGINGNVFALAVSGSDVYVGGAFTSAGGVAGTAYVAKWNGSAWSALGRGANSDVRALAVSGSDVVDFDAFTSVYSSGTTPVAGTGYIARWNGTTSTWSALGSGVNNSVNALAVGAAEPAPAAFQGGTASAAHAAMAPVPALFIGGSFTAAGDGTPASYFTYYTASDVLLSLIHI